MAGRAIWITTFATNFVSCSALKVNASLDVLGCRRAFSLTVEAYVFWLLTTCCLNSCFLYSGHLLYDVICGPLQLAHLGFLVSLFRHPLCEWFSPQMRHFCFDKKNPTVFSRMTETLAVVALHDRNWRSKFFHLVYSAGYLAD